MRGKKIRNNLGIDQPFQNALPKLKKKEKNYDNMVNVTSLSKL